MRGKKALGGSPFGLVGRLRKLKTSRVIATLVHKLHFIFINYVHTVKHTVYHFMRQQMPFKGNASIN